MSNHPSPTRPELSEPRLRALYDYWDGKRCARPMPTRADLDPLEMRAWLGNLVLIDVTPDRRFVYRLYGTVFVDSFGIDMTGRSVDDLPAEQRERVHADYEAVRAGGQPRARLYTALFEATSTGLRPPPPGGLRAPQVVTWERLVLPLGGAAADVAMLLVGAYPLADLRPST
ncbi:MAG TPA: PAS domain-containing protein [Alphaproteobacteria bacterium]